MKEHGDSERLPSPEAVDLGCARAWLASLSIRAHLPPITPPPPAIWPSVQGPQLLPGSSAGAQSQAALPPEAGQALQARLPRRPRARTGHGSLGGPCRTAAPRSPGLPASRPLGPDPGPAPPPSSTWDVPEPGAAAKAETSPPLPPASESGGGGWVERGPRLLRPDRDTWGGGWMEHSPSATAAVVAAAPGQRVLPARAPPRALAAQR